MMANIDVETRARHDGEGIVRTKRRASRRSGASRDSYRTRMCSSEEYLEEWSESFVPAKGDTRAEEVGVSAAVRVERCLRGRREKRHPAVVIAAKISHQSYVSVEVVCNRGTPAVQVAHAVFERGGRRAPERISEKPFDLGGVVSRLVPTVHRRNRTAGESPGLGLPACGGSQRWLFGSAQLGLRGDCRCNDGSGGITVVRVWL